jgi:hypothetical protein
VWGDLGKVECPTRSGGIFTEAVCRTAAAVVGKPWYVVTETDSLYPKGCIWNTITGNVFLNLPTPVPGTGNAIARVLCSVGALPRARLRGVYMPEVPFS